MCLLLATYAGVWSVKSGRLILFYQEVKKAIFRIYWKSRCLFASKIRIPAATDTFIESIFPCMGILIF